jgi:hypothetical protein
MPTRKALPDVMGETLGAQTGEQASKQEGLQANTVTSTPATEERPAAVSFYLPPSVIDALDEGQAVLRKMAREHGRRGRVTKSAILEAALRAALEDLEANGKASMLASKLSA